LFVPFTLSHPAAVIPFARRPFVLSALVIGSMSPDFEMFLTLSNNATFAHSVRGLFLFCLPAGLTALFLFHSCFKKPLLSLLPLAVAERLQPSKKEFEFAPLRQFVLILLSIFIGAASHVIWDSFTHQHGWFVERVAFLQSALLETRYGSLRVYKLLQHASTIFGAAVIGWWLLKWFKNSRPGAAELEVKLPEKTKAILVFAMLAVAGLSAAAYGLYRETAWSSFRAFRFFVGHAAIGGMTFIFIELAVFSALWHVVARKRLKTARA